MITNKILRAIDSGGFLRGKMKLEIRQLILSMGPKRIVSELVLAGLIYTYSELTQEPFPELEPIVARSPYDYQYASRVLMLKGDNASFWGNYRTWVDKGMLPIHPITHAAYDKIRQALSKPISNT